MNKLVFKVNGPKDGTLSSLLKAVTKFKCRIYIDIENDSVTVENVNDDCIDSVIDLINEYYVLLGVEIDTILEEERVVLSVEEFPLEDSNAKEPEAKSEVTDVKESEAEISEEHAPNITSADVVPTTREVGPQGPDDLIVKKIEFQNPAIENAMNKLANAAFWAMYKQSGSEKEIVNHIWTSIREMESRYHRVFVRRYCRMLLRNTSS